MVGQLERLLVIVGALRTLLQFLLPPSLNLGAAGFPSCKFQTSSIQETIER